jgi:hypothetical protein
LPFIRDTEAHVRYLVSLPLPILAELIVHLRMRPLLAQFVERGLVAGETRPRFDAILASAMRLRNSVVIEVIFLALVYTVGHSYWRAQHTVEQETWLGSPTTAGFVLTWAGSWAGWVSTPLFQFLLLRWYFRMFLWWRLLWQISRLPLRLFPTHPDRAGGLGFLGESPIAFAPLLLAQSVLLSGVIAERILFHGASLPDFKQQIGGAAMILLLLVLVPLFFFANQLTGCGGAASRSTERSRAATWPTSTGSGCAGAGPRTSPWWAPPTCNRWRTSGQPRVRPDDTPGTVRAAGADPDPDRGGRAAPAAAAHDVPARRAAEQARRDPALTAQPFLPPLASRCASATAASGVSTRKAMVSIR